MSLTRRSVLTSAFVVPFFGHALAEYLNSPYIKVDTNRHELTIYSGGGSKTYLAFFGPNENDKRIVKDGATPRGNFYVCQKSKNPPRQNLGSRWMRLSYPSYDDAERGIKSGLISEQQYRKILEALDKRQIPPQDTRLGGGIGIHGTPPLVQRFHGLYRGLHRTTPGAASFISDLFDMTDGCVALFNRDVEELYNLTPIGTRVEIA